MPTPAQQIALQEIKKLKREKLSLEEQFVEIKILLALVARPQEP